MAPWYLVIAVFSAPLSAAPLHPLSDAELAKPPALPNIDPRDPAQRQQFLQALNERAEWIRNYNQRLAQYEVVRELELLRQLKRPLQQERDRDELLKRSGLPPLSGVKSSELLRLQLQALRAERETRAGSNR